jgi:hypothetical protein
MVFGPVSARQNDSGILALSGLDRFITLIQASLPLQERAMLFGDSIFCRLLQSITTYYRASVPNILTVALLKSNAALRLARQTIEKNIMALPAVSKEFATTPKKVITGKKAPLCIGATWGLSPINELLYWFQW